MSPKAPTTPVQLRPRHGRPQHPGRGKAQHAAADRGGADPARCGDHRVESGRTARGRRHLLNWITWTAFAIELVVMLAVVPDRRNWLRHNPLAPIIVVLTPPRPSPRPAGPAGAAPAPPAVAAAPRADLARGLLPAGIALRSAARGADRARRRRPLRRPRAPEPAPRRLGRDLLGGDDDDHARLRASTRRRPAARSSRPSSSSSGSASWRC